MFKIVFDNAARDAVRLSALDRQVITDVATIAEVPFVVVTRTSSTPEEQALAMYRNCIAYGAESQLKLYGNYGDLVIHVFNDSLANGITAEAAVVAAMARMIRQIGPERVSGHCTSRWAERHVIDLSAKRIEKPKHAAFEAAIAAEKRIAKHFSPYTAHVDPAFHIEIPQA
jgi:hypothetical protein